MASPLLPTMSRGHNALCDALPDLLCALIYTLVDSAPPPSGLRCWRLRLFAVPDVGRLSRTRPW